MKDSAVLDYLAELLECTNTEDMTRLTASLGAQNVTVSQVAHAIVATVNDFSRYADAAIEASQKLQEMRLIAILEELPEDIQERVRQKFLEVDDDLLNDDNEGDN